MRLFCCPAPAREAGCGVRMDDGRRSKEWMRPCNGWMRVRTSFVRVRIGWMKRSSLDLRWRICRMRGFIPGMRGCTSILRRRTVDLRDCTFDVLDRMDALRCRIRDVRRRIGSLERRWFFVLAVTGEEHRGFRRSHSGGLRASPAQATASRLKPLLQRLLLWERRTSRCCGLGRWKASRLRRSHRGPRGAAGVSLPAECRRCGARVRKLLDSGDTPAALFRTPGFADTVR
jgi:hypothetical protein